MGGYTICATASLPDGREYLAASVHAPDRKATPMHLEGLDPVAVKRPSLSSARINDVTFAGLAKLTDSSPRFIVAGDWNTARQQRDERAGREFFDRMRGQEWFDCVWDEERGELPTRFGRGGSQIQDDHVFCDRALGAKRQGAWVLEEAATQLHLSDHAPLIVDFDVPFLSQTNLIEPTQSDTI